MNDYSNVALVLKSRGFLWSFPEINKVLSQSASISFDEEWTKFMEVIKRITGIDVPITTETSQTESATIASVGSDRNAFPADNTNSNSLERTAVDAPHAVATREIARNVTAWDFFKQIIDPAGNAGHINKESFDTALFEALRKSLNGYVEATVDLNWIVLKNSIVGFGRSIDRTTLGFEKDYVQSMDSKSGHSCFVLGSSAIVLLKPSRSLHEDATGKKRKASQNEGTKFWFNDLTSTVELQQEDSSCEAFTLDCHSIQKPELEGAHGPMGQAIMHAMDSWHCLARRGVSVASVPVVVLAGRKGISDADKESKKANICCLEGHVQIPQYAGIEFTYSIDRIVSFNGTTGLFPDEGVRDNESRDKRSIAVYIKTMRLGLENALTVMINRHCEEAVPLVSLCCRSLLNCETDAQLIASPIPREEDQKKAEQLKISQGELFHMSSPIKVMFSGLTGLLWFVTVADEHHPLTSDCLVKVSCAAVHDFYVPPDICNDALHSLYIECINNEALKAKLAEVLLGFYFKRKSMTFMCIMKDLRTGDKPFTILEHQKFRVQGKLPQLWNAFCELVMSLLLPMADVNVVHLDIRSTHQYTYNILVYEKEYRINSEVQDTTLQENVIELCLIDFDGVVLSTTAAAVDSKGQDNAICMNKLGANNESAYHYLFWQLLWIAYCWLPPPLVKSYDQKEAKTKTNHFVSFLFKEKYYSEFEAKLGDHYETLKKMNLRKVTRDDIQNALKYLRCLF